jgi:hypothetical protein
LERDQTDYPRPPAIQRDYETIALAIIMLKKILNYNEQNTIINSESNWDNWFRGFCIRNKKLRKLKNIFRENGIEMIKITKEIK